MMIDSRKRIGTGIRSSWLAALALVGVCGAGCVDGMPSDDEAEATAPVPGSELAADVVHSFTQPTGDVIECVRREQQPSLRGLPAHARTIATPPGVAPSGGSAPASRDGMEAFLVPGQRDAGGGERACPDGTVPIRQVTPDDPASLATLDARMRQLSPSGRSPESQLLGSTEVHQHAVARQIGLPNQGAHTRINVWQTYVEEANELSSSRLMVSRGAGADLQAVFAGVHTFPYRYRDQLPRLFIYSTSDGSPGTTGCYNLDCGRFVQVDGSVVLGGALASVSVAGAAQAEAEISVLLFQGNWWLGVNGKWVGYYPGSLFDAAGLAHGADNLELGGEVLEDRTMHPTRHTTTDMGSGAFPAAWFGYAAYQRDMYYWPDPSHAYYLARLETYRTDASCYDVSFHTSSDPAWRTYLFMGGSGYNASCL